MRQGASPWVSVIAFLSYLILGQDAFYKSDAHHFVMRVQSGELLDTLHPFYAPIVALVHECFAPLGLTVFRSAQVASALGTAIGVFFLHRASRTRNEGGGSAAAMLCAASPSIVFFATVIEVHGVFFAFAGMCWLLEAYVHRRPTTLGFVRLGVGLGISTFAHPTGHLLPAVILTWWFLSSKHRKSASSLQQVSWVASSLAAHVVAVVVMTLTLSVFGFHNPLADQVDFAHGSLLTEYAQRIQRGDLLLRSLLRDWVLAFFPLSLTFVAGLRASVKRMRLQVPFLALTVLAYCVMTHLLVGAHEQGAYLLPLAWPAALLTANHLPRRVVFVLVLISGLFAVYQVKTHDRTNGDPRYIEGVLAATQGERVLLLVAHKNEVEWVLRQDRDLLLPELLFWLAMNERNLERHLPRVRETIDAHLHDGRAVYLGGWTALAMRGNQIGAAGRRLFDYLQAEYELVPRTEKPFLALRVVERESE